jgi:HD-GYP domain-containing protein (c-di-GMP phosphodiesterase class II)
VLREYFGSLPSPLYNMARFHHERWDGRGYPDRLAGEAIPACARLLAILDAFDAMTSARPYRRPKSRVEAIAVLVEGAASQFDPTLVLAVLPVLAVCPCGGP